MIKFKVQLRKKTTIVFQGQEVYSKIRKQLFDFFFWKNTISCTCSCSNVEKCIFKCIINNFENKLSD